MSIRSVAAAAPLLLAISGCAIHTLYPGTREIRDAERIQTSNWGKKFTVARGIDYAGDPARPTLLGDLYTPLGSERSPAILLVHGGGWDGGSRGQMNPIAEKLAENGFVVFNVDYSLAPIRLFPAPIVELVTAVRWMRKNASARGIDPDRIGAFGYSAGANLVSLLALTDYGPEARVAAVVSGGTPADVVRFPDSPLVKKFIGGTLDENRGRWELASPERLVGKTSARPAFFLYHGRGDWIVDPGQMDTFSAALVAKGYPVETYSVPLIGHISLFLFGEGAVDRGIEFLKKTLGSG